MSRSPFRAEERWEHASLLAAGTSPCKRAAEAAQATWWGDRSLAASGSWAGGGGLAFAALGEEPGSPFHGHEGWDLEVLDRLAFRQLGPSVRHSGWLLKAYGEGPTRVWRSRFMFLTADRLCYMPDPEQEAVRYLPLDRIPVRALPRGYGPKLGVTLVEDRQVDRSHPQLSPKRAGCVFSVACGSHTHFFAAPSPADARAWVESITAAWVACVAHTARSTSSPSAAEALILKEERWRLQSEALRRSAAEAEQQRLRESTAAWQAAAAAAAAVEPDADQMVCYDIEVATGPQPDAGTSSQVYLELCGQAGSSGEHRLMYREGSGRAAFGAGATDAFKLCCQPLGELTKVRVYHSNAGPRPAWFLEEVRVRQQGGPRWTVFPCGRWLAVNQDDGRVLRELASASTQTADPQPAAQPAPPPPQPTSAAPAPPPAPAPAPAPAEEPEPVAAERVVQPTWYTVVVCTGEEDGAGLAPPASEGAAPPAVFLVLHGSRGSSQRVKLPAQAGDFERGQEDVFRVQLPCVGAMEMLTMGLSGAGKQASWLLDQVEVTDESLGETVFFPCSARIGAAKGSSERTVLACRTNPREAQKEVARLRQQAKASKQQLAEAQAELAAARAVASSAEQARQGQQAELEARLAALQAEVGQLRKNLGEAQAGSAAAAAQVEALRGQLGRAEEQAAALRREQEAGRQREGDEASRAAQMAAQVRALHDELAEAQEAAAAAAARARKCEADARRAEQALDDLRGEQEEQKQDLSASLADNESEVRRLRAEVAAKAAELREAKRAEAEFVVSLEQLSKDLAVERQQAKEKLEAAQKAAAEATAAAAASAAAAAAATASSQPSTPAAAASSKLLATYRVCVRTCATPPQAGTSKPVWLELVGSQGSTGAIQLDRKASLSCFHAGSADAFQLEAPAVGDLQQLNIWVEAGEAAMAAAEDAASGTPTAAAAPASPSAAAGSNEEASWHLDSVEVAVQGSGPPRLAYFVCRKWLDGRNGYRAELPASSRNPQQEEVEYKVVVFTSGVAGCGTSGNVCLDLQGDKGSSGVLTLRNRGGSFRPAQSDAFTFKLPALGALSQLRVGHDGRREWHLERVEVVDTASGTTFFFPCGRWVPGGAMSRALHLRGYTTDPSSLPVRYRAELEVEGVEGAPLAADGLRLTLFGPRGESGAQHVDASRAAPGRTLTGWFEAENVGAMERLRIGLAPAPPGQNSGLLLSRITLTNMPTGEAATFYCSEWLRSADPYDLELDAAGTDGQEQQEEVACLYRVEVQTSDVRKAGTPGSVFLTVIGDACTLGPYQLSNTEAEHFQRGQLDVFEIDGAPDCGRLRQIEVRHDGQGRSQGWHLAWIKVTNASTGAVAMFKCNRWVDKRAHTDPGVVGIVVALPPDQAAAAAAHQRSAQDAVLLKGSTGAVKGGGALAPATLAAAASKAPLMQALRMEMDVGGAHDAPAVQAPVAGQQAGPPGYCVVFHTTRTCGSGTRAKVHFELTGANGSSGVLKPVGTSRSFGAGRLDIFDFPSMPYLGELQSARVGTDGSGFFPAWHLALLVVTHIPTGRVWQFSCYNWIDKKNNYSRWLQLDSNAYGSQKAAPPVPSQYGALPAARYSGLQHEGSLRSSGGSGSYAHHLQGSPYGAGRSGPPSPTRFAAQQQQLHQQAQQQQWQRQSGSPSKAQQGVRRPASPPRGRPGWQQQRGSPYMLRSNGSGIPGSPLIAAGRPLPGDGLAY